MVVTGSKETGDKFTEAQASAAWLEQHGVPRRRRRRGRAATTRGPTCRWRAAALHQRGLTKVLIVTDGFHEDRSLAIASNLGLQAWPAPATDSPIKGWATVPYYAKETVGVALGRIIGYSRLHRLG